MPLLLLVFLFIGIPIIEISLLLRIGSAIGGLNTIVFVIFTAVLGAYLVKQQGIATLTKFQEEANSGRIPAKQMLEGIALLLAGAVLLTPGFMTDAVGFALLIPQLRSLIINWGIKKGVKGPVSFGYPPSGFPRQPKPNDSVIEGDYTSAPDDKK